MLPEKGSSADAKHAFTEEGFGKVPQASAAAVTTGSIWSHPTVSQHMLGIR